MTCLRREGAGNALFIVGERRTIFFRVVLLGGLEDGMARSSRLGIFLGEFVPVSYMGFRSVYLPGIYVANQRHCFYKLRRVGIGRGYFFTHGSFAVLTAFYAFLHLLFAAVVLTAMGIATVLIEQRGVDCNAQSCVNIRREVSSEQILLLPWCYSW